MDLERPLHYQKERKIEQVKGCRGRFLFTRVLNINNGKDGGQESVPVTRSHGDKRIGEWSGPALFQFNRERVFGIWKTHATRKACLGGRDYRLSLIRALAVIVSIVKGKRRDISSVSEESLISFWTVSRVAREYLEAPLHKWEPYSRQGRICTL